ncbi:MAG: hypothetical protein HFJ27_01495 [Clostridia bacterium]|nr:hypothetical protein [Clostridia bacterium]
MLRNFFYRFLFIGFCLTLFILLGFLLFKPIYVAESVFIPYSFHPYDICLRYPILWKKIKFYFALFYIFSIFICSNFLYSTIFHRCFSKKRKTNLSCQTISNSNSISLLVGKNEQNNLVSIPEKSLYQNIFVCGTIGSGKTSSCMYPFTKQLLCYGNNVLNQKIGMLILDVKGNFYKEVLCFAKFANRLNDVSVIELGRKHFL